MPANPRPGGETPVERCIGWFPELLELREGTLVPRSRDGELPENLEGEVGSEGLVTTWAANEVGRSLVRAVEFATTSKSLLDRDRSRLLLTMEKSARLLAESGQRRSAGVMVAYLIELGLGARRCPPEEINWHLDPLVSLARLHVDFDTGKTINLDLAVGTAAGVLKVADAITSARARDHLERRGDVWQPLPEDGMPSADVEKIAQRTCTELRQVPDLRAFTILERTRHACPHAQEWAILLATNDRFEPRELPFMLPTNVGIVELLHERLA
ncbi:hypothetical protein [Humibacillus xanthopallidus]|uniref:hypothetical protein n=1 Tax=Humibacillus xanthopallidus TaxID=412689 RepID=UPI00384A5CB4